MFLPPLTGCSGKPSLDVVGQPHWLVGTGHDMNREQLEFEQLVYAANLLLLPFDREN